MTSLGHHGQSSPRLVVEDERGKVGLQDQSILLSRNLASLDELRLPPYLQLSSSSCERVRWNIKVTLSDNKEHL